MRLGRSHIIGAAVALIAIIGVGVFYLFDGFELFTGDKELARRRILAEDFGKYAKAYQKRTLPWTIDLNSMHVTPDGMKQIDEELVPKYVEIDKNNGINPREYNYFADGRIRIGSEYSGYLTLRLPKSGRFEHKYLLRVYDKYGTLRAKMSTAEFVGDTKFLNITEMIIYKNMKMKLTDKGVIMSANCDSIASIFTSEVRDYQIGAQGAIERLK